LHWEAFQYVGVTCHERAVRPQRVLEFGSLIVNGSARALFPQEETSYFGIDLLPGLGVDLVLDAADVRVTEIVGDGFDLVLCLEVLEHTASGPAICRNAFRALRQGGIFIVTAAGPKRAVHSISGEAKLLPGEHYANIASAQLLWWLMSAGFVEGSVTEGRAGQDVYGHFVKP